MKRLTITLNYTLWNTLKLQAKVLDRSLSKHITIILRNHLNIQDPSITEAIVRLQKQGTTRYIGTAEELKEALAGEGHFKIES